MNSRLEQLREIAEDCRRKFDQKQVDPDFLRTLYGLYVPERSQVHAWSISAILPHFPRHSCTIASAYLLHATGDGELRKVRLAGNGHTVVHFGYLDGPEPTIGDITGDQYVGPPVYVGPLIEPWSVGD